MAKCRKKPVVIEAVDAICPLGINHDDSSALRSRSKTTSPAEEANGE